MPPESAAQQVDEVDLSRRASGGDDAAWQALVSRHNHRLVLWLLSRGCTLDEARDLAQETWTRLTGKRSKGELQQIELPGLAIRQAQFLLLDRVRESRSQGRSISPEKTELADAGPSPEERLLSREQLLAARQALLTCPAKAQSVFRFVYENPELPHAEVAQRVGLSLQRVRQTLCEVRAVIREALEVQS